LGNAKNRSMKIKIILIFVSIQFMISDQK